MKNLSLIALAVAGCLYMAASNPAHANDDRFTLRLGAMQADADTKFKGAVDFNNERYDYSSEWLEMSDETVPRIDGMFRVADRHRFFFNYFKYDKDHRYTLGEDISFGDTTIPSGSFAKGKAQFDLASLVYDFALVETPTTSFGLQIGAEWVRLKGSVYAESGNDSFSSSEQQSGYAPVVGARFSANTPDEKWQFSVQGQYLDAEWGDFDDYKGDISRANAIVEYRFTDNFGIYGGYDWFKLDASRKENGLTYGLDHRFKGPIAGITLAF